MYTSTTKQESFSSTLLDQIYRSIDDEGETKSTTEKTKFYTQKTPTVIKTDTKHNNKPKIENIVTVAKEKHNRKSNQRDHEQDTLFFSSTSISSDSSSGGFSSSDTDSLYTTTKSRATRVSSCFAPPWPKPVRTSFTSASFRYEKEKQGNRVSETKKGEKNRGGEEVILIKSKSRADKIYNNLKKVKQPISPRFTNFLNSLFCNEKKKINDKKMIFSSCSGSSFSGSCSNTTLKTASFSMKDDKKTVCFGGVEERRVKVEEGSRKFLNEYRCCYNDQKNKRNDSVLLVKDLCINNGIEEDYGYDYDNDDDDVASCASSDLFELDHLGDGRICEELPVYGTTRVNRVIN